MKTTFLIISYNQEQFIRPCLESVLRQQYSDLQIIFSDDHSTDGTYDLIEEVCADYSGPHEIVLNKNPENLVWDHLHRVLPMIQGDLCILGCGDDIFMSDRIQRIVARHSETRASVITSNAILIDESGNHMKPYRDATAEHDVSARAFLTNGATPACFGAGLAWHREIWDAFGPMRPGPRNYDQVIPFRGLLLHGNSYIGEPLLLWRQHAGNQTFDWREMRNPALGTDIENLRRVERHLNNQSANWLAIADDIEHLSNTRKERVDLPALHAAATKRAMGHCREWAVFRAKLAKDGIGVY